MKKLLLFILLIFVFSYQTAAYIDYSFSVNAKMLEDGSAHITEKTIILFENKEERQEFEQNLNNGVSSVTEWRRFSNKIKFHFSGAIINQKITAKKEFTLGIDYGSVTIDYDLLSLMTKEKQTSRKTLYMLNSDVLVFEKTKSGEIVLGNNIQLTFEIPKDATIVKAEPQANIEHENTYTWIGPISRKWEFQFEREISLGQEVNEFFSEAVEGITDSVPLILLILFLGFLILILIKFRQK